MGSLMSYIYYRFMAILFFSFVSLYQLFFLFIHLSIYFMLPSFVFLGMNFNSFPFSNRLRFLSSQITSYSFPYTFFAFFFFIPSFIISFFLGSRGMGFCSHFDSIRKVFLHIILLLIRYPFAKQIRLVIRVLISQYHN